MNRLSWLQPSLRLLRNKGYLKWLLASQLMGLPSLMSPLAFVLLAQDILHSAASGGTMVAIYVAAMTVASLPLSRLMDRWGAFTVMPVLFAVGSISLAAEVCTAVSLPVPASLLYVLTAIAGIGSAGSSGAMRSILSNTVASEDLPSALALNATILEVVVIMAPLLVAATALLSPVGGVVCMAIVSTLVALLVLSFRPGAKALPPNTHVDIPATPSSFRNGWISPRFLFWAASSLSFGTVFGCLETGILPLMKNLHYGLGMAAGLLNILSVASILGGVLYVAISSKIKLPEHNQSVILLMITALALGALGIRPSLAVVFGSMLLLGFCTTPLNTVRSLAVDKEIPAANKSLGFNIISVLYSLGYALGGLLLAILPVQWMLMTGAILALSPAAVAPFVFAQPRRHRLVETDIAD